MVVSAPARMVVAPAYWKGVKPERSSTKLAAMVMGMSDWLSSVWNWPGVPTAPIAARKVPAQSSAAMYMKRRCGSRRISSVMRLWSGSSASTGS